MATPSEDLQAEIDALIAKKAALAQAEAAPEPPPPPPPPVPVIEKPLVPISEEGVPIVGTPPVVDEIPVAAAKAEPVEPAEPEPVVTNDHPLVDAPLVQACVDPGPLVQTMTVEAVHEMFAMIKSLLAAEQAKIVELQNEMAALKKSVQPQIAFGPPVTLSAGHESYQLVTIRSDEKG